MHLKIAALEKPLVLFTLLLTALSGLHAQKSKNRSGNEYFETFEDHLTTRIYLAKKYTSFSMEAPEGTQPLRYKPNSLVSMGVNATYKSLSITLGSGFGFLNPNSDRKGKTRSFDFQTHLYTRDWATDFYGQFYRGYYLNLGAAPGTSDKNYQVRPDLKVSLLGASTYRILNGERFSYRAGFLQNEWQKQSAGSVLIGAEIYYGRTKGDSALVPAAISSFYPQRDIKRVRFIEFGPGAGYAYTYVYDENFFLTGSATINGDISFVKEQYADRAQNRVSFSPNAMLRAVAGYNSEEWAFTISWIHNTTNARGKSSDHEYRVKTGDFRITIAKRFIPGRKLKRNLDSVIEKLP